jgi:hypothetical protein
MALFKVFCTIKKGIQKQLFKNSFQLFELIKKAHSF